MSENTTTVVPIADIKKLRDKNWLIVLIPGPEASIAGVVNLGNQIAMDLGTDSEGKEHVRGLTLHSYSEKDKEGPGSSCSNSVGSSPTPLSTVLVTYLKDLDHFPGLIRDIAVEEMVNRDTPLVVSVTVRVPSARLNNLPLFMPSKRPWLVIEVGQLAVTHVSSSARRDRFVKRTIEEVIVDILKPIETPSIPQE